MEIKKEKKVYIKVWNQYIYKYIFVPGRYVAGPAAHLAIKYIILYYNIFNTNIIIYYNIFNTNRFFYIYKKRKELGNAALLS